MIIHTWKFVDKSDWPDGPWMSEPDKVHWIYNGLDCLILRNDFGSLCGYVGVPEAHKLHGISLDEIFDSDVDLDCHGGVTFSKPCRPHPDGEHKGICHSEANAANKLVWWIGFDCGHFNDYQPVYHHNSLFHSLEKVAMSLNFEKPIYRTYSYVFEETQRLADQLKNGDF